MTEPTAEQIVADLRRIASLAEATPTGTLNTAADLIERQQKEIERLIKESSEGYWKERYYEVCDRS